MKSPIIYIATLLGFVIISCTATDQTQLVNLGAAKKTVQEYYESGSHDRECSKIIDDAISYLNKTKISEKSVVVFDIDETALSNYQYTKEIGFGYIYKSWNDWQQKGIAPAIKSTKRLYDYLISKNIHVVFLSGREAEMLDPTRKNLIEQGYTKFDTLIVRSESERKLSTVSFKSQKRNELVRKGYEIIASVGDQPDDFAGGNSGYEIKLPNYLYILD
ncbi:MAG: HAD family acid phosphatase [Ignavibacteriales bacterium]|nr:HAD family acid phosphatase [Ignavibacteriales bacterium]